MGVSYIFTTRIAISDRVKNTGNDIRSNNRHQDGERDQGVNFRNAYNALTLCTAFPPFSQNFIAGKKVVARKY